MENRQQFQQHILDWYAQHQRDLPWRKDRDPYHIMVSEIMLQQTQVPRVIPKYQAWMQALPTVEALANAPTAEVLRLWSGLGYNRRALNLQRAAQAIVSSERGQFPTAVEELKQLPGIGQYTASAIACFAFDAQIAVVDTNIRKVIAHHFFDGQLPDDKTVTEVATQLLPQERAYEWNQALMDYASAEMKKEKIPIPKQSNFKTSNRYYRGTIMKTLVQIHELPIKDIPQLFCGDPREKDQEFLDKIVASLEKDKLIVRDKHIIHLP